MVCKVYECNNHDRVLGYCNKHYRRMKKYGDPYEYHLGLWDNDVCYGTYNWGQFLIQNSYLNEQGCWVWCGYINNFGYPKYSNHRLHVISYCFFKQEVSDGEVIHHTCGCKSCVNPDHLVKMDWGKHTRLHNQEITHCPYGHEYTPDNIYVNAKGGRTCKTCARKRSSQRYWQRKQRNEIRQDRS